MNNDSSPKLFVTLAIPKEWVARINEASRECAEVKFVADLYVGGRHANLTMEVSQDKGQVLTVLGRNLFNDHSLKTGRVLMTVAEQNVPHSNGAVP